jgi:hypothetical protein
MERHGYRVAASYMGRAWTAGTGSPRVSPFHAITPAIHFPINAFCCCLSEDHRSFILNDALDA